MFGATASKNFVATILYEGELPSTVDHGARCIFKDVSLFNALRSVPLHLGEAARVKIANKDGLCCFADEIAECGVV